MKKTLLLASTLALGLALTSPAYALGHAGHVGGHTGHAGHVGGHAGHVNGHIGGHVGEHANGHANEHTSGHDSHIDGHTGKNKSSKNNEKQNNDTPKSKNKNKSSKNSEKQNDNTNTSKNYSIQKHYTDQEASRIFKANKLNDADQKAYRRQSIFNNPWIWMLLMSHHHNHAKNTDYAKGYRDGWAAGEKTKATYKESKATSHQSKNYRDGFKAGYQDAQAKTK